MLEEQIDTTPEAPGIPADTTAPADAQVETSDGQTQEQSEQQQRDEKGRFRGVQARIDELTRARHEAEREAAFWRGRAGGQDGQAQPSAAPTAAPTKPTPGQFEDYGEYIEALTDWTTNQALSAREAEREAAQKQQAAVQTWAERQTAARAALPDYDQVVGGADIPVARHVAEVLLDSDQGPALAYHLAKNPDVAARLNGLSPVASAREIGRIEAGLSAQASPAPAKLSNAPPPAGHLKTVAPATQRDPSKMSMDEYKSFRSKQGARWAN